MERLIQTEDTDGNYQITIEDGGPKVSCSDVQRYARSGLSDRFSGSVARNRK
jgi:hypothetical protein